MSAFLFTLGPFGWARRDYVCISTTVGYSRDRRALRRLWYRLWWLK